MSPKLGSVRYANHQLRYLPSESEDLSDISPETRQTIDNEVHRIMAEQYGRAEELLVAHRGALVGLAARLLESETLSGSAVREALEGEMQAAIPRPASILNGVK